MRTASSARTASCPGGFLPTVRDADCILVPGTRFEGCSYRRTNPDGGPTDVVERADTVGTYGGERLAHFDDLASHERQ